MTFVLSEVERRVEVNDKSCPSTSPLGLDTQRTLLDHQRLRSHCPDTCAVRQCGVYFREDEVSGRIAARITISRIVFSMFLVHEGAHPF
jgi:hypothetical protein